MKGTLDAMKRIEEEKAKLKEKTDSLEANLEVCIIIILQFVTKFSPL